VFRKTGVARCCTRPPRTATTASWLNSFSITGPIRTRATERYARPCISPRPPAKCAGFQYLSGNLHPPRSGENSSSCMRSSKAARIRICATRRAGPPRTMQRRGRTAKACRAKLERASRRSLPRFELAGARNSCSSCPACRSTPRTTSARGPRSSRRNLIPFHALSSSGDNVQIKFKIFMSTAFQLQNGGPRNLNSPPWRTRWHTISTR